MGIFLKPNKKDLHELKNFKNSLILLLEKTEEKELEKKIKEFNNMSRGNVKHNN